MLFEGNLLDHTYLTVTFDILIAGCTVFWANLYRHSRQGMYLMAGQHSGSSGDKSSVQVIARAAAILRVLQDESGGLSLGEIAQRVNLARSTVQRIVAALQTEQLVIAATPNGKVRIGPAILRLATSLRSDFLTLARAVLQRLSKELHETVDLAVIKKDRLVFIDQMIGAQRLRAVSAVGESFPLTCTANGKAYLATLSDAAVEALVGRRYEMRTPKSITQLDVLLKELNAVRRTGIAFDREEHTLGICAAGVALKDPLGNAMAISVPVPTLRFTAAQTKIADRLIATKDSLEARVNSAAA